LSVKLDKPVLTNVTDLRLDGDKLVVGTAIFGGTQLVDTVFTGDGPGIVVVKPKSFAPSEGGSPTPVRPMAPRSSTATSRSAAARSWTRPMWSCPVAAGSARPATTR
jgi:electron transfer flavoprotein alpha subunit